MSYFDGLNAPVTQMEGATHIPVVWRGVVVSLVLAVRGLALALKTRTFSLVLKK